MTDKYTEKQLQFYEKATSEAAKDDALFRLGTYLEVLPPEKDDAKLTPEQRETVLDAAKGKVN
jgi:hypothetical protein